MPEPTEPPPPKKEKKKPGLAKRLGCGCFAALFALFLGLLGLEIYLRVSDHSTRGPIAKKDFYSVGDGRTFWPTPGWTGEQTVDERTTSIRINAAGMRGAELPKKAKGQLRVLVLGDSFVFGHGVADDETIPARLQHHLEKALGTPVVVGNAGVAGHGTRDQALMLERHAGFDPDLIVAMTYLGNDFVEDCRRHTMVVQGFLLHGPIARHAPESMRLR